MATKFNDYIGEVEDKANAAGPESVARWDAFNAHYAMAREMRELRKARNLTQKQLAAASGIDQAEISRIERGQTNPTTSTLAALLGPLGARLGVVAVKSRDVAQIQRSVPEAVCLIRALVGDDRAAAFRSIRHVLRVSSVHRVRPRLERCCG